MSVGHTILSTARDKGSSFTGSLLSTKPLLLIGAGVVGGIVLAARKIGAASVMDVQLSTEEALSAFGILNGIGGTVSQVVAANQLKAVQSDNVGFNRLVTPLVISIVATSGAALLLPDE